MANGLSAATTISDVALSRRTSARQSVVVCGLLAVSLFAAVALFAPPDVSAQAGQPQGQTDCVRGTYASFEGQTQVGQPPDDWSGPWFELSQDYPVRHPGYQQWQASEDYRDGPYEKWLETQAPWLAVDVSDLTTDEGALAYIDAVKSYAIPNPQDSDVAWAGRSVTDPWYHVPWMTAGDGGREPNFGLVQELSASPGSLSPTQTDWFQTWAVGVYNELGGWAVGQVWCYPDAPNLSYLNPDPNAPNSFPNGTAALKLLFTAATTEQVPELNGAKIQDAWIPPALGDSGETDYQASRSMRTLRLVQMDMAVRDDRLPLGWAFMTFMYNAKATDDAHWQRMEPVGLQWGDDPGTTPTMVTEQPLQQSWINPKPELQQLHMNHLGWGGRLAGPLDNRNSSCMSCHQTAASPGAPILPEEAPWLTKSDAYIPVVIPERARLPWFSNVPSGVAAGYDERTTADFSLQLTSALQRFYVKTCDPRAFDEHYSVRGGGTPSPAKIAEETCDDLAATVIDADKVAAVDPNKLRVPVWVLVLATFAALTVGVLVTWWWDKRRMKDRQPAQA